MQYINRLIAKCDNTHARRKMFIKQNGDSYFLFLKNLFFNPAIFQLLFEIYILHHRYLRYSATVLCLFNTLLLWFTFLLSCRTYCILY